MRSNFRKENMSSINSVFMFLRKWEFIISRISCSRALNMFVWLYILVNLPLAATAKQKKVEEDETITSTKSSHSSTSTFSGILGAMSLLAILALVIMLAIMVKKKCDQHDTYSNWQNRPGTPLPLFQNHKNAFGNSSPFDTDTPRDSSGSRPDHNALHPQDKWNMDDTPVGTHNSRPMWKRAERISDMEEKIRDSPRGSTNHLGPKDRGKAEMVHEPTIHAKHELPLYHTPNISHNANNTNYSDPQNNHAGKDDDSFKTPSQMSSNSYITSDIPHKTTPPQLQHDKHSVNSKYRASSPNDKTHDSKDKNRLSMEPNNENIASPLSDDSFKTCKTNSGTEDDTKEKTKDWQPDASKSGPHRFSSPDRRDPTTSRGRSTSNNPKKGVSHSRSPCHSYTKPHGTSHDYLPKAPQQLQHDKKSVDSKYSASSPNDKTHDSKDKNRSSREPKHENIASSLSDESFKTCKTNSGNEDDNKEKTKDWQPDSSKRGMHHFSSPDRRGPTRSRDRSTSNDPKKRVPHSRSPSHSYTKPHSTSHDYSPKGDDPHGNSQDRKHPIIRYSKSPSKGTGSSTSPDKERNKKASPNDDQEICFDSPEDLLGAIYSESPKLDSHKKPNASPQKDSAFRNSPDKAAKSKSKKDPRESALLEDRSSLLGTGIPLASKDSRFSVKKISDKEHILQWNASHPNLQQLDPTRDSIQLQIPEVHKTKPSSEGSTPSNLSQQKLTSPFNKEQSGDTMDNRDGGKNYGYENNSLPSVSTTSQTDSFTCGYHLNNKQAKNEAKEHQNRNDPSGTSSSSFSKTIYPSTDFTSASTTSSHLPQDETQWTSNNSPNVAPKNHSANNYPFSNKHETPSSRPTDKDDPKILDPFQTSRKPHGAFQNSTKETDCDTGANSANRNDEHNDPAVGNKSKTSDKRRKSRDSTKKYPTADKDHNKTGSHPPKDYHPEYNKQGHNSGSNRGKIKSQSSDRYPSKSPIKSSDRSEPHEVNERYPFDGPAYGTRHSNRSGSNNSEPHEVNEKYPFDGPAYGTRDSNRSGSNNSEPHEVNEKYLFAGPGYGTRDSNRSHSDNSEAHEVNERYPFVGPGYGTRDANWNKDDISESVLKPLVPSVSLITHHGSASTSSGSDESPKKTGVNPLSNKYAPVKYNQYERAVTEDVMQKKIAIPVHAAPRPLTSQENPAKVDLYDKEGPTYIDQDDADASGSLPRGIFPSHVPRGSEDVSMSPVHTPPTKEHGSKDKSRPYDGKPQLVNGVVPIDDCGTCEKLGIQGHGVPEKQKHSDHLKSSDHRQKKKRLHEAKSSPVAASSAGSSLKSTSNKPSRHAKEGWESGKESPNKEKPEENVTYLPDDYFDFHLKKPNTTERHSACSPFDDFPYARLGRTAKSPCNLEFASMETLCGTRSETSSPLNPYQKALENVPEDCGSSRKSKSPTSSIASESQQYSRTLPKEEYEAIPEDYYKQHHIDPPQLDLPTIASGPQSIPICSGDNITNLDASPSTRHKTPSPIGGGDETLDGTASDLTNSDPSTAHLLYHARQIATVHENPIRPRTEIPVYAEPQRDNDVTRHLSPRVSGMPILNKIMKKLEDPT